MQLRNEIEKEKGNGNVTQFCFAYYSDLEEAYAFYCSRYQNISYDEFLKLGLTEFNMKISSIPETEPLYKIMVSRTINLSSIKDKEERKYWTKLKKENKIPDVYLPRDITKKNMIKQIGGFNIG